MLLICRYLVFGLLVICNAILCSVAVWNLSLAQSVGQNLQVDAFLTFLGAFSLLFIFTIVFIEILRRNAVTGRLWFEVLWVGLFWIMELSGAAAVSAIVPGALCDQSPIGNAACTSTHVLLAFSWLSTALLLGYLVCLVCVAIIRQKRDPQIWRANVIEFWRFDTRHDLRSAPASPSLPRFQKTSEMFAPQPRRPPPIAVYAYRSGMGPEYQIEHFRPSSPVAERPIPTKPPVGAKSSMPTSSLYPQHLHSSLTPQKPSQPSPASPPPPLGKWPHPNAVDQPLRSKRKTQLDNFTFPARDATNPASAAVSPHSSLPPRPKPSGPRTSSSEVHRPPPLDLAKISAFRAINGKSGI